MMTDEEKIEWLWKRLDSLNGEVESFRALVKLLEDKVDAAEEDARRARTEAAGYASELASMALELNNARVAAANAVRDHLAAVGG